jgi:DNA helicase-2/ATP-dependent DNA helicase PcrA
LCLYEAPTDLDEAAFIVEQIKALREDGIRLSHIGLLYRSNAQSRVLEHALFNAALPYRVYGGLRFFERQEIKHALAYLRLVANPEDDNAFLRVVNIPARGIGARSLEQLTDIAQQRGVSLWQAACSQPLSGKAAQGMVVFVHLIEQLRQQCLGLSLPEIVETVIDRSRLKRHYETEREGQDRIENLDELITAAAGFQIEGGGDIATDAASLETDAAQAQDNNPALVELNDFLAHAALEAGEHQAAAGSEALQLMTVHSAKGLEFDAVFISGLEEGLFPHENSLNEADGVEEERRLMYVALTRARRRLYLTHAQTRMLHGHTRYNIVSRFLNEIPPPLLKRLSVRRNFDIGLAPAASFTSQTAASPWRVGQDVTHPKFGQGVIVGVHGRGSDARVMVNFRHGGMKELAIEYAKLSPA